MLGKIFISYHREDRHVAEALYNYLLRAFSAEQLVLGLDKIPGGSSHVDKIKEAITECEVLLVIIGPYWARGLSKTTSYIRFEIEEAFQQRKSIIPVLIDEEAMPPIDRLPHTLQPLLMYSAIRLRNKRFHEGASSLVNMLQKILSATDAKLQQNRDHITPAGSNTILEPEIPPQGYGPHFEIGDDGIITFAPPGSLDQEGNNVDRLKKMHPALRDLSKILVQALGKGNVPHVYLLDRSKAYHELIDREPESIDFSLLYMAGVRLANAEKAATSDSDLPSLPTSVRETIDSLLQLHGTFILASRAGLEAIEAEQRYQRTRQDEADYRTAAIDFAQRLQNQPTVVDPKVALAVLNAAEEIGKGVNPDRSSTVATGILKNVTITFVTAATLGTLTAGALATGSAVLVTVAGAASLVAAEGLKKSKPFAALAAFVTQGIDKTAQAELPGYLENLRERFAPQFRFFLTAEKHLKRLAGERQEFKWLTKTMRWLEQQSGAGGRQFDPVRDKSSDIEPLVPQRTLVGNLYLAKVIRVDPSTQTAFINYSGEDSPGSLAFNEIHPDYYQIPMEDRQRLINQRYQANRTAEANFDRHLNILREFDGKQNEVGASREPGGGFDRMLQYKIDVIKRRQVMLVQVIKDDNVVTLTTYMSLAGRYLSLLPNSERGSVISREITSLEDRVRLNDLIRRLDVPEGMGVLLNSAAASQSEPEINRDFNELIQHWDALRDLILKSQAPTLVYEPNS
jgi:hypothetical protein